MNRNLFGKGIIILIISALILAGCNSSKEPSSAPENTPDYSSPESVSTATESPSSSKIDTPSSDTDELVPEKIVFVKSDDKRLQFTSNTEYVGNADDLERCKSSLQIASDELGLLVVYNGEDGPREYSNEFINEILDIYRRTSLSMIDKIPEQHPSAMTRGIAAAAFYDANGNRQWVVRSIGELVRIELNDSGNVHVFGGTLGM